MIGFWYGVEGLLFTLLTYSTLSSAQTGDKTLSTTVAPTTTTTTTTIAATTITTTTTTTKKLINTEHTFTGPNNTKYTIYKEKKTWLEAKQICEKRKARLAVLDTNATQILINEQLVKLKLKSERIWIGATDSSSEGIWFWVNGPLIVKPLNWDSWDLGLVKGDEPNGGNEENCMNINQKNLGKWNDAACNTNMSFLCQQDACTSRDPSCKLQDGKVLYTNWTECIDGNQTRVQYCVPPQNGGLECVNVTGQVIQHRACGTLATSVILISSLSAWSVLIVVFLVAMVKLKKKELHNKIIMKDYRLGAGKFGKKKKESSKEKIANEIENTPEEDEDGTDPAAIPLVKVSPAE